MAKFWHTEPIWPLDQRTGSLPFGLYPQARVLNSSQSARAEKAGLNAWTPDRLREMAGWCANNLTHPCTWSERYGSFYFADEVDRAKFRLFFPDDEMPEPVAFSSWCPA